MGLKVVTKTVTLRIPDSAGLYWWRKGSGQDWVITKVLDNKSPGWGLTVMRNTHEVPIEELGGEWGDEIIPPPK